MVSMQPDNRWKFNDLQTIHLIIDARKEQSEVERHPVKSPAYWGSFKVWEKSGTILL